MAKIYYTEQEAAERLGISVGDLANYVRDGKIHSYLDGTRKMYKVAEVDGIASSGNSSTGEIELAPADTSSGKVSLSDEAEKPRPATKEDTVISAEGISIFDDEELEIEAADPMAKTQIAPSLADQISDGASSGSGLLDLTRESDDTSLGAEVLDHINMDTASGAGVEGVGSSIGGEELSSTATGVAAGAYPTEGSAAPAPVAVEVVDAVSGAFSGMIVGTAVVLLLLAVVAMGMMTEVVPDFVLTLKSNLLFALIGAAVVLAAGAGVGFMMGKSAAARQAAVQNV